MLHRCITSFLQKIILMQRIAILASGTGSNARNIIHHFENSRRVMVELIASNNVDAGVLGIAAEHGIPSFILTKENFREGDEFLEYLSELEIDFVILAGFLWKVPVSLVRKFEGRILNIHPALLPKFGGKGMYGHHVHEAVYKAKERESGITIHLVNEEYDKGDIVFQASAQLTDEDTPETIEKKVRQLEIKYFPEVIERFITEHPN